MSRVIMIQTPTLFPIMSQLDTNSFNLFKAMESLSFYENVFGDMTADEINLVYLYNHSGLKYCSPLLRNMSLSNPDNHITTEQLNQLAGVIYHMYGRKWKALWETFTVDYNPIENYNMIETSEVKANNSDTENSTTDLKHGHVVTAEDSTTNDLIETLTHGLKVNNNSTVKNTGTDTHNTINDLTDNENGVIAYDTDYNYGKVETVENSGSNNSTTTYENGKKVITEGEVTANQNNSIWGFNSSETAVPRDSSTGNNTSTQTVTNSGTDTETLTGTDTKNGTTTYSGKDTENKTETRDISAGHKGTVDVTDTYNTQNATEGTTINSGEDTTTNKGTIIRGSNTTNSGIDNTTTQNNKTGESSTNSTLQRSGNIGVTTTQQMLSQERQLWLDNYYETLFADIDSVIAIPAY